MRTKDELRAEFIRTMKVTEVTLVKEDYIRWLEQKLIDQEPKQREVSEAIEFTEWCVINAIPLFPLSENSITWNHRENEYSTQELYDLFKSKTN